LKKKYDFCPKNLEFCLNFVFLRQNDDGKKPEIRVLAGFLSEEIQCLPRKI
jgi:hypothetical protein